MAYPRQPQRSLYTSNAQRKYLTQEELTRFLIMAHEAGDREPELNTLCVFLAYTGCRISEALAMTSHAFDLAAGTVSIRSLKKRGQLHVRQLYLPRRLLQDLQNVHHLRQQQAHNQAPPLWPWSRYTAWRKIKLVMTAARIVGPHATCHALRHTFGVQAIRQGIQLHLLQGWLGHAHLSTTSIYATIVGPEERSLMARMWFEGDDIVPTQGHPTNPPAFNISPAAKVIDFAAERQRRLSWPKD